MHINVVDQVGNVIRRQVAETLTQYVCYWQSNVGFFSIHSMGKMAVQHITCQLKKIFLGHLEFAEFDAHYARACMCVSD